MTDFKQRTTINVIASTLSDIFRPSYFPMLGLVLLLIFTYLSMFPWQWKLSLLVMVYIMTIFLPAIGVYTYRRINHLTPQELQLHHNRMVPYMLHIVCYCVLLYLMNIIPVPALISGIIVISLLVQCVCTLITLWWKISIHSAGMGTIMGALIAYSIIFQFNPVWWLCAAIFVSGLVNSSRMLLRQHTLGQVMGGTFVGFLCGLTVLFL